MFDFIELYPDHFQDDITKKILKSEQLMAEQEEKDIQNLLKEFNVNTAKESLPYWCSFAGIEDNPSLDIEIRRNNILAAFKGSSVTTLEVIKQVAESYSNGTCEVIENYSDYSFVVRFISTIGVPAKINEIKKIIDKIKPAHLNYSFEFKYRTWGDIERIGKTWVQWKAQSKTWKDLREGVL